MFSGCTSAGGCTTAAVDVEKQLTSVFLFPPGFFFFLLLVVVLVLSNPQSVHHTGHHSTFSPPHLSPLHRSPPTGCSSWGCSLAGAPFLLVCSVLFSTGSIGPWPACFWPLTLLLLALGPFLVPLLVPGDCQAST